jgi:nitrite reductase/ring-hydroxylating ferredoxin subunit
MAEFIEAGGIEQVPVGTGTTFTVAEKPIAVFNVDGTLYAIADGCLHRGSSLGSGKLDGKVVTCRSHGWRFDVTTGNTMHVPDYGVTSYPVKVVDGKILIAVGQDVPSPAFCLISPEALQPLPAARSFAAAARSTPDQSVDGLHLSLD